MKRDAVRKYSLSYPITTVNWNGERVTRMPDETFLPVCRILKELGVDRWKIPAGGSTKHCGLFRFLRVSFRTEKT